MDAIFRVFNILWDAWMRFLEDDGWAIASHIALSGLMSLFPFLIFVTALGGFFGSKEVADEVTRLILEAWPPAVAEPLSHEIANVLTSWRSDLLTVGVALALYFSSNGLEALRVGLNRAYQCREMRYWYMLRIESIAYVLLAALVLLAVSFLVVLGPLLWVQAVRYAPWLSPFGWIVLFLRLAAASVLLVVALVVLHLFLPAGQRRVVDVAPGIIATIILWIGGAGIFGSYLAHFAQNYVSTYAGLASVMIALVFFYYSAAIFVMGGELNAAIARARGRVLH